MWNADMFCSTEMLILCMKWIDVNMGHGIHLQQQNVWVFSNKMCESLEKAVYHNGFCGKFHCISNFSKNVIHLLADCSHCSGYLDTEWIPYHEWRCHWNKLWNPVSLVMADWVGHITDFNMPITVRCHNNVAQYVKILQTVQGLNWNVSSQKDTTCLLLMIELWGASCGDVTENWSGYMMLLHHIVEIMLWL